MRPFSRIARSIGSRIVRERLPSISVIVPAYNVAPYIWQCVSSILAQLKQRDELIVIDDGSTDATGEILAEISRTNSRLQVLTQPNLGVGVARNAGITVAKGDYLAFVDSDDWLLPSALETWRGLAALGSPDVAFTNRSTFEEDTGRFSPGTRCKDQSPAPIEEFASEAGQGAVTAKIFKRRLVVENQLRFPDVRYWEDNVFVYAANIVAVTAASSQKTSYMVRKRHSAHDKSITQRRLDPAVLEARFEIIPMCLQLVDDGRLSQRFPKFSFVETHFGQLVWHHALGLVEDPLADPASLLDPIRAFATPYMPRIRAEARADTIRAYEALIVGNYDEVIQIVRERREKRRAREQKSQS